MRGWKPTATGYATQGFLKYGFYEYFKHSFAGIFGQEYCSKHTSSVYLLAGTFAEIMADLTLAPMEAVRIRMVENPNFAKSLSGGFLNIARNEGISK